MSSLKSIVVLPSCLAIPVIPAEEISVGRALFHNFIHDEFQQEGYSDEAVIDTSNNDIVMEHLAMAQNHGFEQGDGVPAVVQNIVVRGIGSDIRDLANEFARSRQRQQIRQHADEVDLQQLDFDGFWALLEEVFRHGINVYNIVALFYFCSDILIRSVKLQLAHIGMNLFKWALKYISEKVCKWVCEHGGWEKALKRVMTKKYVAYGAATVIFFAVGWGIYKGLKN